ncbi:peroxidase-related enzyme [Sphingobium mellinum]|uniref:peroxidase-related enzyme n=1 Tax=Sphingobium mellinum TaxID=1387166 RepID=UPI0030EB7B11
MPEDKPTLTLDYKGAGDPYGYLSGVEGYELPQEWVENMEVPELHSTRIIASYNQAGFERSGAYMQPIFLDPEYGALTMAQREFIGVVVSAVNACPTCLIIHSHKLGELIGDHGRARRIAINYRAVGLSRQERAIADYCVKLTEQPGRMEAADVQSLRDTGLSDEEIYYVIETAAVFNLTNRMTSGYGMRPDDDFMASIVPNT